MRGETELQTLESLCFIIRIDRIKAAFSVKPNIDQITHSNP